MSITFEASEYSQDKFELYKKYQVGVHHDLEQELKPSSFKRFLCESPLPDTPYKGSSLKINRDHSDLPSHYGSWHVVYRLEEEEKDETERSSDISSKPGKGKIIALAVVDVLPKCLSSVYFAYDPAYKKLALGKVG